MVQGCETVSQILLHWVAADPARRVFTFVPDRGEDQHLTLAELHRGARAVAVMLEERNLGGERVLLLCASGLDYIVALFGCFYAGAIAVPCYPPRPGRSLARLDGIVDDCQAAAALTTRKMATGLDPLLDRHPGLRSLHWLVVQQCISDSAERWSGPPTTGSALALLQYTSGSTATPRGVRLTHANLLHNCELMRRALQISSESHGVFWLPLYHDMGLIGGVLATLCAGGCSTLMSPTTFIRQPIRWLEAIAREKATHSVAPTIGYEICVREVKQEQVAGLDLCTWQFAGVSSEPVREGTLRRFAEHFSPARFRASAFTPCYGLAEATVFVTGTVRSTNPVTLEVDDSALQHDRVSLSCGSSKPRVLVGCGQAPEGVRLEIVNPSTRQRCGPDEVGEIWVAGTSVAQGYWNQPDLSVETFQAYLSDGDGPFLKSGDLGFVRDGELFVTGRLKDLVVLSGRNHYPQDIEQTAESAHRVLRAGCTAAFTVETETEANLVIVAEIDRGFPVEQADEVILAVRRAVSEEHELEVFSVVLVKSGQLPKTSSGKIQRGCARQLQLANELDAIATWTNSGSDEFDRLAGTAEVLRGEEDIQFWLTNCISQRMGISRQRIDVKVPFTSLGLTSLAAVQIAGELEVCLGEPVSPTLVYDYPTIEKLARHLAGLGAEDRMVGLTTDQWPEPIAIVGIGCRLPGSPNPSAYWDLVRNGRDALREMPDWRWGNDVEPLKAEFPALSRGGFLENVDQFDPEFFGISVREAVSMDPQQRMLLEVVWEALEDAGLPPAKLPNSRSGVFLGISSSDFIHMLLRLDERMKRIDPYTATGNAHSIAANRLSYLLNLNGPSFAVDTACSSSLVAVHLACRSLLNRECDLAVAAGVNICLVPDLSLAFSRAGMLSPDGICKAFDADANGYVRGDGCGAIVIRRLSDALAAGDTVLALIRSSAVNQDGRSAGLTAPSGPAQQAVVRQALVCAGLKPDDISYVEAHGTGTALGDPIEANALAEVYGTGSSAEPCCMGTVKANIGHLEAASGIAGLIKVALMLQARQLPPQPHFRSLNPLIRLEGKRLRVLRDGGPWTVAEGRRRAGCSSFGFGGTNAHVILEEAPMDEQAVPPPLVGPRVLPLSARTKAALQEQARRHLRFIDENPHVKLDDLCRVAAIGRTHFEHRLAIQASSLAEVRTALVDFLQRRASGGVLTSVGHPSDCNRPAESSAPPPGGSLAEQFVAGSQVDWTKIYNGRPHVRLRLPTYPFQRRSLWPSSGNGVCPPLLETSVSLAGRPELGDHKMGGAVVVPATAFVEFALAATSRIGAGPWQLEEMALRRPLVLAGEEERRLRVVALSDRDSVGLRILTLNGSDPASDTSWRESAVCTACALAEDAQASSSVESLEALRARFTREVPTVEFYRRLSALGLEYGLRFQGVSRLWLGGGEALGLIAPPFGTPLAARLDACLQVAAPCAPPVLTGSGRLILPTRVERLQLHDIADEDLWCWAKRRDDSGEIDLLIFATDGQVRASIQGLRLEQVPREMLGTDKDDEWHDWLYQLEWRSEKSLSSDDILALTEAPPTDRALFRARAPEHQAAAQTGRPWVLFSDETGCAERLSTAAHPEGGCVVVVRPAQVFERVSNRSYQINPELPGDYRRLLEEIQDSAGQPPQGLVYLWGLDAPDVAGLDATGLLIAEKAVLNPVIHLVGAIRQTIRQPVRIWFCTRGVHALGDDQVAVAQATLWGLSRSLDLELPDLRSTIIDLDPVTDPGESRRLWLEFLADGPEPQLAYRAGERLVARLGQTPWKPLAHRPLRLISTEPGTFDSLEFQPCERRPPGAGDVEVAVSAASLNFRDVLHALDLIPSPGWFGGECAGVVVATGPGVAELAVGDEVVGLASASFGTHAVTPASLLVRRPKSLSPEDATTIPVGFLTSYYGLIKIAKLKRNERVLIHSAAGGVGLAAVQLAEHVGAQVYATAGNPEKRAFLESLGVRHVFDSRSLKFADEIMQQTNGEGIDVVLNSLINDAIPQSLGLLKKGGRFVELGRLGTWEPSRVHEHRPDVAYTILPLDRLVQEDPVAVGATLRVVMDLFVNGALKPLPRRTFAAHDAAEAFRYMASAKHIGKIVISLDEITQTGGGSPVVFAADATYLIVGGLGGLGLKVACWMAERGARHLVLTGRSARQSDEIPILRHLEAHGVDLVIDAGDVSRREDVVRVLDRIDAQLPPLRGVIHSAGVLDDGWVEQQTWQRFVNVLGPKVLGAWNLHELTKDRPLDHFVVFSSLAGLCGSPGQTNYASANTFLDALCHERSRLGLPATSINWGAWSEVGAATKHETEYVLVAKTGKISPTQGVESLEWVMGSRLTQVAVSPADWRELARELPSIALPLLGDFTTCAANSSSLGAPTEVKGSRFVDSLRALPGAERRGRLLEHICELVAKALRLGAADQIDTSRPLQDLGFDSLMAVEMRNVLQNSLGVALPATLLFDQSTVDGIADYIFRTLDLGAALSVPAASSSVVAESLSDHTDAVAVVGMGCRFPGGARSPDVFWQLLLEGFDAVRRIPEGRWNNDRYYDPNPDAPRTIATRYGSFLEQIDGFDAELFQISPREAAFMDPQQRLILEVVWEALEHAGQAPDRLLGTRTGVFMGVCNNDYSRLIEDLIATDAYGASGNVLSAISGRVSYLLGLQGPSMALDTACSSSLVAVHLACRNLLDHSCDLALAGGVNLIILPQSFAVLSRLHFLAPDGRCKAFSASADGFGRGEGAGVVVLKRVSDARQAGDRILAIVRGTAINHDGRSAGLAAPNAKAQEEVIRRALAGANVDPLQVAYVEAHGTGTVLGDPIEVSALASAYGVNRPLDKPLLLGSVKSNVGHLEAAAGVAGFMKAVLTVQHGEVPPTLHVDALNPHIPWVENPIRVARSQTPWPDQTGARLAGVSSFGLSGTNAHVIVEDAGQTEISSDEGRVPTLLTLSAMTLPALREQAGQMSHWLEKNPLVSLADFCWTLNSGRARLAHRLALVARSVEQMRDVLACFADGETPPGLTMGHVRGSRPSRAAFLFLDPGTAWVDEVQRLAIVEPVVQAELGRLHKGLALDASTPGAEKRWALAGQLALAALWRSWGIEPTCTLGHRVGLLSAACVAGLIGEADAGRALAGDPPGVSWPEARLGLMGADGVWLTDTDAFLTQLKHPPGDTAFGLRALRDQKYDPVLVVGSSCPRDGLLGDLADWFAKGVINDVSTLDGRARRRKLALPTYPFQRRRHWLEPIVAKASPSSQKRTVSAGPLLGERVISPLTDIQFECPLGPRSPWRDSGLGLRGPAVPPGVLLAQIEMALEVSGKGSRFLLQDVEFTEPLFISEQSEPVMQVVLSSSDEAASDFSWRALSHDAAPQSPWVLHARGSGTLQPLRSNGELLETARGSKSREPVNGAVPPRAEPLRRGWQELSGADLYQRLVGNVAHRNPRFAWLENVRFSPLEAVGWWRSSGGDDEPEQYPLHPGLLEGAMQLLAPWTGQNGSLSVPMPVRIDTVSFLGRPRGAVVGRAELREDRREQGLMVIDLTLYDESTLPAIKFEGLLVQFGTRSSESIARHDKIYKVAWRSIARQVLNAAPATQRDEWLIVAPGGSSILSDVLTAFLGASGTSCRVLQPSEAQPALASNFQGRPCVVYLAGREAVPHAEGSQLFTEGLRECAGIQDFVRTAPGRQGCVSRLYLVTQGGQCVGSEETPLRLSQAPIWGLGRTMATSHAGSVVLIDLDPDVAPELQSRMLHEELVHPDGETQLAFRRGRRYVARMTQAAIEPTKGGSLRLHKEGAYLVTDGLSGVGLGVARWLAEKGAGRLVLTGKTEPSSSALGVLNELRKSGVGIQVELLDVASRDDLAELLGAFGREVPPLRGVVHCAGVLDESACRAVGTRSPGGALAPKTAGAWMLHERTQQQPLDFFVLFSTASALLGSGDQETGAAASAFLDGLAWHRRAAGLPALAVNWGPWENCTAVSGAGRCYWEALGVEPAPEGQMLAELEMLLVSGSAAPAQVAVLAADWARAESEAANLVPLLRELVVPDPSSMTPTMVFAIRQELLALEGEERKQRMRHYIRQALAKVAGPRAAELDFRQPLLSLGLDSLTMLDMLAAFHEKLEVPISFDKLPPEASLDQLAGMMAALLEQPASEQDEHAVRQGELLSPTENADLGSLTGLLYTSSWRLQSLPGCHTSSDSIPPATVLPLATLVQTVAAAVDHLISPEQHERYQELERKLDRLCAAYAACALLHLGADLSQDRRFTT
ncbi:MAG: SDR family NAD(P)-dependent oxidoreductase, partial [Isosphaeraceae bacterium]